MFLAHWVKHTTQPDGDQRDWLIGQGLFTAQCERDLPLRSMKAPRHGLLMNPVLGKDPQPATMAGYVNSTPG